MLERTQQYLLDVVEGRKNTRPATVVKGLLTAVSKLYFLGVQARVFLFKCSLLRSHSLGVTVISVGNITLGGTGKTPVVERLARELRDGGSQVRVVASDACLVNDCEWAFDMEEGEPVDVGEPEVDTDTDTEDPCAVVDPSLAAGVKLVDGVCLGTAVDDVR